MKAAASRAGQLFLFIAALFAVLSLYSYPYLRNWRASMTKRVPPLLSDNVYLYLNVAMMHELGDSTLQNPWYGNVISENDIAYRKFGLGIVPFAFLERLTNGHRALALFLWNTGWIVATIAAAMWLLTILGLASRPSSFGFAFALLMLFHIPVGLSALNHWLETGQQILLTLPYYRSFFPQVAVPLLLLYLAVQLKALRGHSITNWITLVAIQAVAFAAFPYAAVLMLATTALACLLMPMTGGLRPDLRRAGLLFASSIAIDLLYLFANGSPARGFGEAGTPVLELRATLPDRYQLAVTSIIAALSAFIWAARRHAPEVAATHVAAGCALLLAAGIAALLFSPVLQVPLHLFYFAHTVMALLGAAALAMMLHAGRSPRPGLLVAATTVLLVYGIAASASNASFHEDANRRLGTVAAKLGALSLQPTDLLIGPSDTDDEVTSWYPLLGRGEVLFYYYGEYFVPPDQSSLHWQRLSLYLYFKGLTSEAVERALRSGDGASAFAQFLAAHRRLQYLKGTKAAAALNAVERDLMPHLRAWENDPRAVDRFLSNYRRIAVLEPSLQPMFDETRIRRHLRIHDDSSFAGLRLRMASALVPPTTRGRP